MENEYDIPGREQTPTTEAPVPQQVNPEETSPAPCRFAEAKKAFSKAGLAILVLFLVMQGIGTVLALVGTLATVLPDMISTILSDPEHYRLGTEGYAELLQNMISDIRGNILPWTLIGTVVGLAVALIFFRRILRKIPAEPIPRRRLNAKEYFFMLFVALGLWGVGALIGNLPSLFGLFNPLDSVMGGGEGLWGVLFTLYAMFGAPILEELAFRKLLLDKVHGYGEVPAAFLSAVMFGLFHGNSAQFMLAFMVGLAFATVYLKTRNVWYSISFHFIINTVASLSDIFRLITGKDTLLGLDTGWWTWILVGTCAVIGCTVMLIGRRSELLALKRPDYLNCNRILFRNVGSIIFIILVAINVLANDLLMLLVNLFPGFSFDAVTVDPKAFLSLLPTVLFGIVLIALLKTVGKHADLPE